MDTTKIEYWCTYERGQTGKIYTAGSVYIALSASSTRCNVLTEDSTLEDATRWAVFTPKHHKYLFAELFKSAWERLYANYNQGINFKFDDLRFLKFPQIDVSMLDALEPCLKDVDTQIQEITKTIQETEKAKAYFIDKMFVKC